MKKIWNKWSYAKRGAFLGFLVWLVAILSLLFSVVSYRLGMYSLEMFFGSVSILILGVPFKIISGYLSGGADISLFFFVYLVLVVVSLFLYPLLGALIGYIISTIKDRSSS